MYKWILITLLLTGCITEDGVYDPCEVFNEECIDSSMIPSIPNYNDHALYVGDSMCAKVHDDIGTLHPISFVPRPINVIL